MVINKRFYFNWINIALLTSIALTPSPANSGLAEGELSYNAALVSKYLWRGFDLNDEGPALQGGLDYEHESGFYSGAWAS
jgi:uncharacterized protein (TIGR02001 family)